MKNSKLNAWKNKIIIEEDAETEKFTNIGSRKAKYLWVFFGGFLFVSILAIVIIVDSLHTINEGKVGVYFVNGALQNEVSNPGVHWSVPFSTKVEEIAVRPQKDILPTFETVTKDGIKISFSGIKVMSEVDVNILIQLIWKFGLEFREALVFDKIREELVTICANNTLDDVYGDMFLNIAGIIKENVQTSINTFGLGGIKILNLIINKPEIPADIAENYIAIKVQWTEELVANNSQKTEKIKQETETMKALLDANRQKEVVQIEIEIDIMKKEGERNMSAIDDDIVKQRQQNLADVEKYRKMKEADANQRLYSPDYVRLEMARSLSNNTKFFFSGDQSPLGAVMAKIMGQNPIQ